MNIKLIKYSSIDNSAVLITDTTPTSILITDSNNKLFIITNKTTVQSNIGYVTTFNTAVLINEDEETADLSKVSIVKATDQFFESADAAMYDELIFASTKIDMITALMNDNDRSEFYKYVVKFLFLETAMNDIAKQVGAIEDCLSFYNELDKLKNNFKTKYHYNERL